MTSFSSTIQALNTTHETKEEAIQSAYDSRSQSWKDRVLSIVYDLARERSLLSADDVVRMVESCEDLERSYVALPAVFKIAKANGWITEALCSCGEEVKTCESQRISNHGRRILVYKSKLFPYNLP